MEKVFKKLMVFLSYILIIANIFMIFAIPSYLKSDRKIDIFSSLEIAENIRNPLPLAGRGFC